MPLFVKARSFLRNLFLSRRVDAELDQEVRAHLELLIAENILALLERREASFEWLERSVGSGFACRPFFQKDPCLKNLRDLPAFELLVSSLQAKYPDHLGLL